MHLILCCCSWDVCRSMLCDKKKTESYMRDTDVLRLYIWYYILNISTCPLHHRSLHGYNGNIGLNLLLNLFILELILLSDLNQGKFKI